MSKLFQGLSVALLLGVAQSGFAATIALYDAGLGGTPSSQPWLIYGSDGILSGGTASQTAQAGGTQLVTDGAVSAGYSNYNPFTLTPINGAFPILDATAGFSLDFDLHINAESHSNANRAGFSVLLLDENSVGIELGFWENEIWAQNVGFTHGEGVAFDTTASANHFELSIVNSVYTLAADSVQILSGSVRDYTSPGVPYELGSYLFLGDDTGSAGADVFLGSITLNTAIAPTSSVPVPGSLILLLSGLAVLFRRGVQHEICRSFFHRFA
ncbi:MAG: hypothetical protein KDH88_00450 [Chromatiales bacterium]|nr:hypothetical protein [Chromatiales bacterium]